MLMMKFVGVSLLQTCTLFVSLISADDDDDDGDEGDEDGDDMASVTFLFKTVSYLYFSLSPPFHSTSKALLKEIV